MILRIQLNVKFRLFRITYGHVSREWLIPIPIVATMAESTVLDFHERGIDLVVKVYSANSSE